MADADDRAGAPCALSGPGSEDGAEAARVALQAVMAMWGGPEACIDAYEAGIRATSDMQLMIARVLDVEPARGYAAGWADFTRDFGATQVSRARWLLDV